jgi:hypothetical protein
MKALQQQAVSLAIALFISTTTALAQQSLWLTHDSSWRIEGRELVIQVANITNPTTEDSGPLFLSVYAQSGGAYDGGSPGTLIGRAPLDAIPASGQATGVELRTRLKAARTGLRYTALMLERQVGKKFTIVDWVAFTSTYSFTRKQDGGMGSQDSAIGIGDIYVSGGSLGTGGRRISFSIDKLQNQRETTMTGTLRVTLYATAQPYAGGTPDGQRIFSRVLGQLAPGDFFHKISANALVKRPRPRGDYYVSLIIEEEQQDGFVPVALVVQSPPTKF